MVSRDAVTQLLREAQALQLAGRLEDASYLFHKYYSQRPFHNQYLPSIFSQRRKNKPRLSIIVPCHNSAKYIQQCIDSILAQQFTDFELIIVDDGSTDNSLSLILEYALVDDRIILLKNDIPSGSAGLPRNQALEVAQGELVGFVDSDDWIGPDYFQILVETIDKNNADVCISSGFINHQGDHANERLYPRKWSIKSPNLGLACTHMSSMIWDKVYKIDLLKKYNILLGSYPAAVDVPFILKVYYHCNSPVLADTIAYHYRRETENSVTVKFRKGSSCDFELKAYKEIFEWSDENGVPETFKSFMQVKRLASFVYTCKLVKINFFQSYFDKCRKILMGSDIPSFRENLLAAGQKELLIVLELFINNDKLGFVKTQRSDDLAYFFQENKHDRASIASTILLEPQSTRGKISNLVYFPDWSSSNPYQHLFYTNLQKANVTAEGLNIIGLGIEQVNKENLFKIINHGDIVHIHWVHPFISSDDQMNRFCNILELLKKQKKALIVWTIHNTISHECVDRDEELLRRKHVASYCDHFIVHSNHASDEVQKLYGVKSNSIYVIPHGKYPVDLENLLKHRSRLSPQKRSMRLTMLGDLRGYKNTEWAVGFISSLNKLIEAEYHIELRVAGKPVSSQQTEYLNDFANKYKFISLNLKRLSDDELFMEFCTTDIIFAPYSKMLTSGICLNSISHGRPFLAPKFPSLMELHHEERSLLYENQDELVQLLLKYNQFFHRGLLDIIFDPKKIISGSSDLEWSNIFQRLNENPFAP